MSKITQLNLDGALLEVKDPRFENDKFFQYNLGTISETPDTSQNETLQKIYDAAASGGSVMAIYDGILLDVSEVSADKMVLSSSSGLTFLKINATVTAGAVTEAVRISTTPIIYGEVDYEDGVTPLPTGTIYCYWGGVVKKDGLMFSSPNPFTMTYGPDTLTQTYASTYVSPATIEISSDAENWTVYTPGDPIVATEVTNSNGTQYQFYIKTDGHVNTPLLNPAELASSGSYWFKCTEGSDIKISGDLDWMWGKKSMQAAECADFYAAYTGESMFGGMFVGISAITDVSEMVFPSETTKACYSKMFTNCSELKKISKIPAAEIADFAFTHMYQGCPKLDTVPNDLLGNSTTIGMSACLDMFRNCHSLTEAPALPAKTIGDIGYMSMFAGCENLTSPAVFSEFTSVSSNQAFREMYDGCSSITWVNTGGTPFKITTADGSTAADATLKMFQSNSGSLPEGTGTPKLNTTYYYVE